MAETDDNQAGVAALVEELSGASRRRRQEVAHKLALVAKKDPSMLLPHVDALVDALFRPEAQTRWEVLVALTAIAEQDAAKVAPAFEGAEASLFDDGSAMVRLAAFVFLCRLAADSPERSNEAWPLLDEAIQCYHGDAEYRDMLVALLGVARGQASDATKKALADRVRFDSENGAGYIKTLSAEIIQALA